MATLSSSPTAPPKLYRVGEIVRHTGLSRQTIHNYTTMGLIHEAEWTPGGHRVYGESVFDRLSRIAALKRSRTMQDILRILDEQDAATQPRMAGSRG